MIGERLYDLRKDAGLTQDDLADIININKHSISSYEREKSEPPDAIKILIAKYFDVSVDYLLGMTDNPKPAEHSAEYIKLPQSLPDDAKKSIYEYVDFLSNKYSDKKLVK